jgi:hypothetical protein
LYSHKTEPGEVLIDNSVCTPFLQGRWKGKEM